MEHKHEWSDTVVTWPGGSRAGLRCACGLVAVAPLDEKKRSHWKKEMTK